MLLDIRSAVRPFEGGVRQGGAVRLNSPKHKEIVCFQFESRGRTRSLTGTFTPSFLLSGGRMDVRTNEGGFGFKHSETIL